GRDDGGGAGEGRRETGEGPLGRHGRGGDPGVRKDLERHDDDVTGRRRGDASKQLRLLAEDGLTGVAKSVDLVLCQAPTTVTLLRPRIPPHVISVLLPESRQIFL